MRARITIAFWIVYVGTASLSSGANLSGRWRLEGNDQRWLAYETHVGYDYDGQLLWNYEGFVDREGEEYFECEGSAVQYGTNIEGYLTGRSFCGEEVKVEFTGSIFADNQVEFEFTVPGGSESCCYTDEDCCDYSYTEVVACFNGIYDPNSRVIRGSFEMKRERLYEEWWNHDKYWFVESTNIEQNGTFKITICCSECDREQQWKILVEPCGENTPKDEPLDTITADSNESLKIWCIEEYDFYYYVLIYHRTKLDEEGYCIAKCWFYGGCNTIWYTGPDENGNEKPDCFHRIVWQNRDFAYPDCVPEYSEHVVCIEHRYDAYNDRLTVDREILKYPDGCTAPISGEPDESGNLKKTCILHDNCPLDKFERDVPLDLLLINEPLGDETENFFKNTDVCRPEVLYSYSSYMTGDLDLDGDCDEEDLLIIESALGKRRGEVGYFPHADVDGDGCVTDLDIEEFMIEP